MLYKILYIIPLFFLAVLSISCESDSVAQQFPECFTGTYLNSEGSGTQSIFTFTSDGNFIGTSSAQEILNFGTELGSWVATSGNKAKAVFLDFSFGENGELESAARVDMNITFIGNNCGTTEGNFELRFFDESEDPLDISTDTGETLSDTFTGRKIVAE